MPLPSTSRIRPPILPAYSVWLWWVMRCASKVKEESNHHTVRSQWIRTWKMSCGDWWMRMERRYEWLTVALGVVCSNKTDDYKKCYLVHQRQGYWLLMIWILRRILGISRVCPLFEYMVLHTSNLKYFSCSKLSSIPPSILLVCRNTVSTQEGTVNVGFHSNPYHQCQKQ